MIESALYDGYLHIDGFAYYVFSGKICHVMVGGMKFHQDQEVQLETGLAKVIKIHLPRQNDHGSKILEVMMVGNVLLSHRVGVNEARPVAQ